LDHALVLVAELLQRLQHGVAELLVAHQHALPRRAFVGEVLAAAAVVEVAEVALLAAAALLRARTPPDVVELAVGDHLDPSRERRAGLDLELADVLADL